jgi:hypothetical protein
MAKMAMLGNLVAGFYEKKDELHHRVEIQVIQKDDFTAHCDEFGNMRAVLEFKQNSKILLKGNSQK